ncbi:hypothetical protein BJ912DRAFT_950696 [Pholiota molesta]|nr:hypothetical protein BJ912DRAFT_950696 [Pholiota molesta]
MPASCRKSNPQFAEEQRSYFRQKCKELLKLGLKKTKAFWRDDGLVIEWSSDVLVWSDTLKPDIPDLATAIQRAYALNDRNLPRKNSQRQQRDSAMNDASSPGSVTLIEPPASSSSQSPSTQRKRPTPAKHWADGIPREELKHATNLSAPLPTRRQPPAESQRRPSLPTRTQTTKPTAVPSKLPFTQPDPSAAIPSQEWRMRRGRRFVILCADDVFLAVNPEGKEWFWV